MEERVASQMNRSNFLSLLKMQLSTSAGPSFNTIRLEKLRRAPQHLSSEEGGSLFFEGAVHPEKIVKFTCFDVLCRQEIDLEGATEINRVKHGHLLPCYVEDGGHGKLHEKACLFQAKHG